MSQPPVEQDPISSALTGQGSQQQHQQREQQEHDDDFPELTADDVEEVDEGAENDDVPMDSDDEEGGQAGGEDDRMVLSDTSVGAFFEHKGESIFSIALHPSYPNPPLAVSGGADDQSFIWNATNGEVVQKLQPKHTDSVTMVKWNSTGEMVASGGMDGMINVWKKSKESWGQWDHVGTLEGGDEVQFLTWHPKGNVLVAGYGDATTWMWQLPSCDVMQVFSGHEEPVTAGAFTPDGRRLLTTSTDASLIFYDPRQPTPLAKLSKNDSRFYSDGGFVTLAISPDAKLAAVGSVIGQSRVVSLPTAASEQSGAPPTLNVVCALEGHQSGESIEGLAFLNLLATQTTSSSSGTPSNAAVNSANANYVLVTAGTDGKAIVWDTTTQKVRVECVHFDDDDGSGRGTQGAEGEQQGGSLTTLVPHGAGPLFTTASSSGTLQTWDARTGKLVEKHSGFAEGVLDADVKRDVGGQGGWRIVGAGDEGVALIFKC